MSQIWAIDLLHKLMIVLVGLIAVVAIINLLFNDKWKKGRIKWNVLAIMTKNGERLIVSMYQDGRIMGRYRSLRQAEYAMKRISKDKNIKILTDKDRMF